LQYLKNILGKELFKVGSLNGISVLIRIAVGFVSSKVLAIFVGPAGMALVGNLRNFTTTIESIGTLGFQNGIIKYVAQHEDDEAQLKKILSTLMISILGATLVLSGFLYFFASYLNDTIFGADFHFRSVFIAFSLSLPWYIASLFLVAVLSGFGAFRKVIKTNIYGSILGLGLSVTLVYHYHTFGALLSIILAPSLLFFIAVFQVNAIVPFSKMGFSSFDFSVVKNLSHYSLMALVSAVFGPLVYLSIRNNVIATLGIEKAGYWEAMFRISSYYLLFLTTILTVYFLPKLAKATSNDETKSIFRSYLKGVFPVFAIGLMVLYFLRDLVVPLLFTKEFSFVSKLFFWQIIGDLFRALSLMLGYQFFAKKLTKAFIFFELLSLLVLWISSNYLITVYDIQGIVMAHAVTYGVYLIALAIYFRKSIF
jgi:O-antigen/teichoic acid export membrane protein